VWVEKALRHHLVERPRRKSTGNLADVLRTLRRCGINLVLRLRKPAHVVAEMASSVHQRVERCEIACARVQAKEVETDTLERGDALGKIRRRLFAPRAQPLRVDGAGRSETGE